MGFAGPLRSPRSSTSYPSPRRASPSPATRMASGPIEVPLTPAPTSVGAPMREIARREIVAGSCSMGRIPSVTLRGARNIRSRQQHRGTEKWNEILGIGQFGHEIDAMAFARTLLLVQDPERREVFERKS